MGTGKPIWKDLNMHLNIRVDGDNIEKTQDTEWLFDKVEEYNDMKERIEERDRRYERCECWKNVNPGCEKCNGWCAQCNVQATKVLSLWHPINTVFGRYDPVEHDTVCAYSFWIELDSESTSASYSSSSEYE